MCYPMVFTNLRTFGSYGQSTDSSGNAPSTCPQNWEVQVPQDQGFESWFSANVIFNTGNGAIQTLTGAVGML